MESIKDCKLSPIYIVSRFSKKKIQPMLWEATCQEWKMEPVFLIGHRRALGDLDFADLFFLFGTVFGVQDSVLVCTEGGEIPVLLCN